MGRVEVLLVGKVVEVGRSVMIGVVVLVVGMVVMVVVGVVVLVEERVVVVEVMVPVGEGNVGGRVMVIRRIVMVVEVGEGDGVGGGSQWLVRVMEWDSCAGTGQQ